MITGDRPMHPLGKVLRRPHDGIVSVDEARVDGMSDFLVVHRGHTLIMNDRVVAAQAVHFFRHGRFRR